MLVYIIGLVFLAITLIAAFGPWFKGYRTLVFNILSGAIVPGAALLEYLGTLDWTQYVDEKIAPWIVLAISVINIILRFKTSTPIGVKPPVMVRE